MSTLARFLNRHTLWAGFAAVLVPLIVLLGLQYMWLQRLSEMSAIAHKASFSNFLEAVVTEVEYFYKSAAERALNIPASLFTQRRLEKVAYLWKKKPVEGAKRLFLVDFTGNTYGNFHVYNPEEGILESPPASDESLAMIVAAIPWQIISGSSGMEESLSLRVDERNPEYRFILNPITDENAALLGLAGMIVDEEYFREKLLPDVIRNSVTKFFPSREEHDLVVTIRDDEGTIAVSTGSMDGKWNPASKKFSFIFTSWSVDLHQLGQSPEQWAKASFASNMTLAVLIALILLGGVLLAFHLANRAIVLSGMKSDFVSNVSHELRTPLASIRVFAELLKLGKTSDPVKASEYGGFIEAESRRLSRLIDNILDFSRIESGQKTYHFQPSSLEEIVRATLSSFEVRMKESGFKVVLDLPERPVPSVDLDADAIGQALNNLLDNAVKYSGDSREVSVKVSREGQAAVLSVTDRGIGIHASEQKKIFERFHRVGTGLVHDVKGSGLGLSIVNHVVRAHGGSVEVSSQPGEGSTFTIRLPLEPGSAGGAERSGARETADGTAGTR